jgi:hypothetical protein
MDWGCLTKGCWRAYPPEYRRLAEELGPTGVDGPADPGDVMGRPVFHYADIAD